MRSILVDKLAQNAKRTIDVEFDNGVLQTFDGITQFWNQIIGGQYTPFDFIEITFLSEDAQEGEEANLFTLSRSLVCEPENGAAKISFFWSFLDDEGVKCIYTHDDLQNAVFALANENNN
jgi:hypothetical protein